MGSVPGFLPKMPKNRFMKTRHKVLLFTSCTISIILITLALINSLFLFESRTFLWHLMHPQPSEWNDLKITVPKDFVGQYNNNNELTMYKMKDATEIFITFDEIKYAIRNEKDLDTLFRRLNYDVIEQKKVYVFGVESCWIRALSKNDEINYREYIYPLSVPIRISFMGKEDNRNVFEEIINDVKWEPGWAEKFVEDK